MASQDDAKCPGPFPHRGTVVRSAHGDVDSTARLPCRRCRMMISLVAAVPLMATASVPQTAPPGPVPVPPANGAALVQPITLRWNPIVDPDGPIGSYTWEVSTSSTFGSVIATGFNNLASPEIPLATDAQVSGLANGTYFW